MDAMLLDDNLPRRHETPYYLPGEDRMAVRRYPNGTMVVSGNDRRSLTYLSDTPKAKGLSTLLAASLNATLQSLRLIKIPEVSRILMSFASLKADIENGVYSLDWADLCRIIARVEKIFTELQRIYHIGSTRNNLRATLSGVFKENPLIAQLNQAGAEIHGLITQVESLAL